MEEIGNRRPHARLQHRSAVAALLLGSVSGYRACAAPLQAVNTPSITYFDVAQDPGFNGYKPLLQHLAQHHPHRSGNSFCVLGYAAEDGTKAAWVLWSQGAEIFHWTGNQAPLDSPQTLHLKTDVVATEDEVGTSTYLVTRAWVTNLQHTCDARGQKLHFPAIR